MTRFFTAVSELTESTEAVMKTNDLFCCPCHGVVLFMASPFPLVSAPRVLEGVIPQQQSVSDVFFFCSQSGAILTWAFGPFALSLENNH
jgi:hypothetical protein